VHQTQLNSAGPHTTSACQELFANYPKLNHTRSGYPRLDLIIPNLQQFAKSTWQVRLRTV